MSLDASKCYIGTLADPASGLFALKNSYNTFSAASTAYSGGTGTFTGGTEWPLFDAAFSPDFTYSSTVYVYGGTTPKSTDLNSLQAGILFAFDSDGTSAVTPPQFTWASSTTGSYGISNSDELFVFSGIDEVTGFSYFRRIREVPSGKTVFRASKTADIDNKIMREIGLVYMQEMPRNFHLTTYKRTMNAPTVQKIKTLDGSIRQYITGLSSSSVTATFKWSDDGRSAKNLQAILYNVIVRARPVVVYTPTGIYYDRKAIDLVVPTVEPTITMPAPGVYELTIEGECQP